MAEITSGEIRNHRKTMGVKRMKKQTPRIDLTPMVDLGFLLITFFIFTTSMSQPKVMKVVLPDDTGDSPMPIKRSGALTLLPGSNDVVYYYEGCFQVNGINLHPCTIKGIRQIIMNKKNLTPAKNLFVTIKPAKVSSYQNLVDLLDEMTINDIKSYALADITVAEESMVK